MTVLLGTVAPLLLRSATRDPGMARWGFYRDGRIVLDHLAPASPGLNGPVLFVSCRLAAKRPLLGDPDFACLAHVVRQRRAKHRFLLTAWVFLPNHWHALINQSHRR